MMAAKDSRQKFDEKQDIYILLIRYLLITKGKTVTLKWRNLAGTTSS